MPIDEIQIEQLVLDEMSGIITLEDSITLKKLLEEEPGAIAIRNAIYKQFSGEKEQVILAMLPETLPVEKVWIRIQGKRKTRIYIRTAISVAASLVLFTGIFLLFRQENPHQPIAYKLPPKTVILQLPGGQTVNLSTTPQHTQVGDVTLNNHNKKLSYVSGSKEGGRMAVLTVPSGKDYTLQLSDGTEVQLNAATRLQFPFTFSGNTREVTIDGEAYLKIAPDAKKPFIVHLPNSTIQVLGTEFNVNTYDSGSVKVALVKGSVRMQTNSDSLLLRPGHMAVYHNGKDIQTAGFDAEELLAWRQGIYIFHAVAAEDMCRVVIRWYGVNVIYDNPGIGKRRFTGYIDRNKPIRHFLDDLQFTGHFDYYFDKDSILHIR
ncbi:FecR family protein [Chitinophaga sp. YR573]|uniref:FecR family protein n=1 Tax=Chitinophaga sp. YR573 TaxID=1881040 RepID=UPI0008CC3D07|nr:FecR domain-containing protein [Chitinophaga sp. YR573]SEW04204.1 FecR family protein [Chitinophaga sp. YR573]